MTRHDYPMGATVTFVDDSATTTAGTVVATGPVNGPVIEAREGTFVPVFAQRDNGREATTVYVAAANIVDVKS